MQAITQAENRSQGSRDSTHLQEITDLRLRAPLKDRRQNPSLGLGPRDRQSHCLRQKQKPSWGSATLDSTEGDDETNRGTGILLPYMEGGAMNLMVGPCD